MGPCHCGAPALARGLCGKHYRQDYRARGADRRVNEQRARTEARRAALAERKRQRFIHTRQKARGLPRFMVQMFSSLPGSLNDWTALAESIGGGARPCRDCGAPPSWGVCPVCAREIGFVEPIVAGTLPHNDIVVGREAA